jgi:hypothetical protein
LAEADSVEAVFVASRRALGWEEYYATCGALS